MEDSIDNTLNELKNNNENLIVAKSVDVIPKENAIVVDEDENARVIISSNYKETLDIALLSKDSLQLNVNSIYMDVNDNNDNMTTNAVINNQLIKKYSNNRIYYEGISILNTEEFNNLGYFKLPGEINQREFSAHLFIYHNNDKIGVRAILTNYRFIFIPIDHNYLERNGFKEDFFCIPINLLEKVEKINEKKPLGVSLDLISKDGRKFKLHFTYNDNSGVMHIQDHNANNNYNNHDYDQILKYLDKLGMNDLFAFSLYIKYSKLEENYNGWHIYSFDKEMSRQGIMYESWTTNNIPTTTTTTHNIRDELQQPNFLYKKVNNYIINHGVICSTYPKQFIIPYLITDEELCKCANFRAKERIPILSYYYKINQHKSSTLWRSSQCKPGITSHRCIEDEIMLRLIGNPKNRDIQKETNITLHIYDARPYLNAFANKMNGKGFELSEYYKNVQIYFMDIDNIHHVKDCYKKLIHLCSNIQSIENKWYSSLELTGWYDIISLILSASRKIVEQSMKKGISALVHCSDGWDRTTQLTSLAQIIIDPYFRTIEGFEVLIEKEWISYGHMFRLRLGHLRKHDEESPIFLQFLDCVHQLVHQFPYEFEFNMKFLSEIAYHAYSSMFGTFLCDNEKELYEFNVRTRTISLWSYINSRKEVYKSELKDTLKDLLHKEHKEILPDANISSMRFWIEHFGYYWMKPISNNTAMKLRVEINSEEDLLNIAYDKEKLEKDILQKQNDLLVDKIKELESLLLKKNKKAEFEVVDDQI